MQKINILFVITKLELGGAQKHLLSLMGLLDKERYNPFLFTSHEGVLFPEALCLKEVTLHGSRCLGRKLNPLKDICVFFEIFRFLKKHKIQVVHTHSSKAGILGRMAARAAGVKIILHTVHGWPFNAFQFPVFRWSAILLEKCIARFTDILIFVSQHDLDKGFSYRIGFSGCYRLIRCGIAADNYPGAAHRIRREFGFDDETCVITNISCFKPQKACLDYIRLADLLVKRGVRAKFLLVGDGLMRPQIEESIRRNHLEEFVKLTGWRRDIPDIFASSDIFVLTSLWEGLPLTVLEAMASSVPVVATDTGGISEVVREGATGFLVSPKDMRTLAERIVFLISNREIRVSMGRLAQVSLGSIYREEVAKDSIEALYRDLLTQKELA